jgi:hypothetical protein
MTGTGPLIHDPIRAQSRHGRVLLPSAGVRTSGRGRNDDRMQRRQSQEAIPHSRAEDCQWARSGRLLLKSGIEGVQHGHHGSEDLVIVRARRPYPRENRFESGCLGQRAIFDIPTAAIALIGLGLLLKFRLQEPVLVAAAGLVGLVIWPFLRGG